MSASAPANDRRAGRELWRIAAGVVVGLFLAGLILLGMRTGSRLSLWFFVQGRFWLALGALIVLAWGTIASLRRRPFVQRGRLVLLVGCALVFGVVNLPFPYPSPREGRPSAVPFRLPFEGAWTTIWGGATTDGNRLAAFYPDRRFGYDFTVVDEDGRRFAGTGERPEDWLAFGRPVLAPCAGTVERVQDGLPDVAPGLRAPDADPNGNHVVLRVAQGEYLFLGQLRQGSIVVGPGQLVEPGDPIGEVGSSGASPVTPFPHLAIHLQTTPESRWGAGVPLRFSEVECPGRDCLDAADPRGGIDRGGRLVGDVVRPASADPRPGD